MGSDCFSFWYLQTFYFHLMYLHNNILNSVKVAEWPYFGTVSRKLY